LQKIIPIAGKKMVKIEYIIFLLYMEHNYRAIFLLKLINYIVYNMFQNI